MLQMPHANCVKCNNYDTDTTFRQGESTELKNKKPQFPQKYFSSAYFFIESSPTSSFAGK